MIELVDGSVFKTLGFRYDVSETEASIFAVNIYLTQNKDGGFNYDSTTSEEIVDISARLLEDLSNGPRVVDPHIHFVIGQIFLPYLTKMHEHMPRAMYPGVCAMLGVEPYDLFRHGMTARAMQDDIAPAREFI